MKKLLITMTAALVCVGAFGQGKLSFDINIDNLIYFTTDTSKLVGADATATANGLGTAYSIAGSGLYTGAGSTIGALSGSPTLIAALYGGATASSLTLMTTTTIGDVNLEGTILAQNMTLAAFPSGTPMFLQVQVYDSRNTSAADAWSMQNRYAGEGSIFQATPAVAVYSPMYSALANSTWAPGTFAITDMAAAYGAGTFFGGIQVYATVGAVPEPGTFALAGMGLAALLVFRRRK